MTRGDTGRKSKRTIPRSNSGSVDTWYVAFHNPDATSGENCIRRSKTFRTEAEARAFARALILEGCVITAGTLNPHSPKRIIGFSQLEGWLALD